VRKWMDEEQAGVSKKMLSYLLGYNSLYLDQLIDSSHNINEVRLRFDGLFETAREASILQVSEHHHGAPDIT